MTFPSGATVNFPIESLDVKAVAAAVAKLSGPKRPYIPNLADLALWLAELSGLQERVSHCSTVIALLTPEVSQVENEIETKKQVLAKLQNQMSNNLIAADIRIHFEDLEKRISRLTYQLSDLKERLEGNKRLLVGTKKNIEQFHKDHPQLQELRDAQKALDAANGR